MATGIPVSEMKAKQSTQIRALSKEEIEGMRLVCKLAREVLDEGAKAVKVGVTTDEIDRIVHEASIERNCYPSPLNYHNFPKSCCTSVNEVICHGIPDGRPLEDGDIVNCEYGCAMEAFFSLGVTWFLSNRINALIGNVKRRHFVQQSMMGVVVLTIDL
ncbi:Methionine aminopeptidase 1 [Exaiptasia diaphana]|nr:Methionine aminopeptidase 1 [Exaiptasia diaphana]